MYHGLVLNHYIAKDDLESLTFLPEPPSAGIPDFSYHNLGSYIYLGLNPGPYTYKASTLPMELSLQSLFFLDS